MLENWSESWQLELSLRKRAVLDISNDIRKSYNSHHSYTIGGVVLPVNTESVDLGVTMDSKLRFDTHILTMVHKAHIRTALLRRCFRSRDQNLLFRAFTVYVQPLLEYCSPVWNPHYHCDIAKIESVQRIDLRSILVRLSLLHMLIALIYYARSRLNYDV